MKLKAFIFSAIYCFAALTSSCSSTPAYAQSKFGASVFFAAGKGGSTIVQTKVDDLRFKRFTLDLDIFTGLTWQKNENGLGALLGKRWNPDLDGKFEIYAGVGLAIFGSTEFRLDFKALRPGLAIGLTYRPSF